VAIRTKVAIIGSGNIGTDLMMKVLNLSSGLEIAAIVGIDPESEGLKRARALGIRCISDGLGGLLDTPQFAEVEIVFDATSADAHLQHDAMLRGRGKILVDLTPAAVGPYTVPCVNGDANLDRCNVNMVTCGGQATIPVVAAVNRVAAVVYAEIVASIASRSAGPGTRSNIDEFTQTTARAIEKVGGAGRGKAIIILNPAEPPLMMRNTVYCLSGDDADPRTIETSVREMVEQVRHYVPGYRLKQEIQFERIGGNRPLRIPELGELTGLKTSIFLEVEGAGHYLPRYAGNLDIMTSAALATGERIAERLGARRSA
jgi:acetaldehyde dehydrogenase